jgi:hypothetical protein
MEEEIWDAQRVGQELSNDPDKPVSPGGVRSAMKRGGIRAVHGYPKRAVLAYLSRRKGRGYRSDLKD